MYMIQIERHDRPDSLASSCLFPASTNLPAAVEIWRFMIDNLNPGWQVSLMGDEGQIIKTAVSAVNSKTK